MTVRERTEHSSDGFLLTEMKEGRGVGRRRRGRSRGGGGGRKEADMKDIL